MHAYIVKTPDGYLYPFGQDVSLTDDKASACHFFSTSEANEAAQKLGYVEGGYEVHRIEIEGHKPIKQ
jgi:hypothetical protein